VDKLRHDRPDTRRDVNLRTEGDISFDQPDRLTLGGSG